MTTSFPPHTSSDVWIVEWLTGCDRQNCPLCCQDWGGLSGRGRGAAVPERFAGVGVANAGLPAGGGWTEGFKSCLDFSQRVPELPIGFILNGGSTRDLSAGEIAAYEAPFPDETFKEGARQFPPLVPITPQHASVDRKSVV